MRYLRDLGDTDPAPVDRKDASWRISAAKAKLKDFGTMNLDGPARNTHTPASERQIQLLRQLGYEGPADISSAEAVKLHSYLRQTTLDQ